MQFTIDTDDQLDDVLTTPSDALVECVAGSSGTVVVLGIGGKVGPTLGVRLRRALDRAGSAVRVVGVSRFTDSTVRQRIEAGGIETLQADLLDPDAVASLPDADRVVYLAGLKFGTTGNEAITWAMNTLPPVYVCRRYAGKPIVAYSTGAVYDISPVTSGGSVEEDPLEPRGEYANAAVARERLFQWAAAEHDTPLCQIRLFYANDLRYGVIRDIAEKVINGAPIDVSVGYVNLIWQGDAVDQSLRAFALATIPPTAINVTGPTIVSTRSLAERLGELLGKKPNLVGESSPDALIGNASRAAAMFGDPDVTLDQMIRWTASWTAAGGTSLGKPTHWDVRNGRY